MPQKIKYFAVQVQNGFKIEGKPSLIWSPIVFLAGLISFVLELLLAICLQIFLLPLTRSLLQQVTESLSEPVLILTILLLLKEILFGTRF